MLGFFTAKGEGFFADYSVAVEEFEATIVLGEAFAGDLNAFDIEFEFVVALNVAREQSEIGAGGVGRGGALEELALECGGNGGVEDGIITVVGVGGGEPGCFELVRGLFGPATMLEAPESGDVGFEAKAIGRGLGDFLGDFGDGHFEEPVVELVELVVRECIES